MNHLSSETLIDYLHGELRPQDDAFVHAHLVQCEECRAARDAEAALTEIVRASAAAQERDFPSLISAAVWQQVRETPPSPLARFAAFLRPAVAVPAALALLVAGWFASPLGHGSFSGTRTVDALYYFEAHAAQSATSPLSEHSGMPAAEPSLSDDTVAPPMIEEYAAYAVPGGFDAVR